MNFSFLELLTQKILIRGILNNADNQSHAQKPLDIPAAFSDPLLSAISVGEKRRDNSGSYIGNSYVCFLSGDSASQPNKLLLPTQD